MNYQTMGLNELLSVACKIQTELGRRTVSHPEDIMPMLDPYRNRKQESLFVVTLDNKNHPIDVHEITRGTANTSLIYQQGIFQAAMMDGAVNIIVAHNHPSGALDESIEDITATKNLVKAGKIVGIPVLDHIIFSPTGYISLNGKGLM